MEFVTHYLTHYDSFEAARQCGYKPEYAFEYARKMMSDPDVIRLIDEKEQSKAKGDEKEFWKNRILKTLWREGNHKGHDSSHGARVSALKEIKNMFDLDGAVKVDATLSGQVTIYLPDNGRDKVVAEDGASN